MGRVSSGLCLLWAALPLAVPDVRSTTLLRACRQVYNDMGGCSDLCQLYSDGRRENATALMKALPHDKRTPGQKVLTQNEANCHELSRIVANSGQFQAILTEKWRVFDQRAWSLCSPRRLSSPPTRASPVRKPSQTLASCRSQNRFGQNSHVFLRSRKSGRGQGQCRHQRTTTARWFGASRGWRLRRGKQRPGSGSAARTGGSSPTSAASRSRSS